jgi:hypothetical protein
MVRSTDILPCTSTDLTVCPNADIFKTAFPNGAQLTSNRAGWTAELQLPTRYVTLIAKYWNGSDLRWYFVGGLLSNFNDTAGLAKNCLDTKGKPAFCEGLSNDGACARLFGVNGSGVASLAPQRPVRSQGGFLNIAFPLSRVFNADAAGRNAGWQLALHCAFDDANAHDVRMIGNTRQKNDLAAGTLSWKLSNLVSFVLEESLYRTRAVGDPTGVKPFPTYRGVPAREWHDFRSEFGPIFTF